MEACFFNFHEIGDPPRLIKKLTDGSSSVKARPPNLRHRMRAKKMTWLKREKDLDLDLISVS